MGVLVDTICQSHACKQAKGAYLCSFITPSVLTHARGFVHPCRCPHRYILPVLLKMQALKRQEEVQEMVRIVPVGDLAQANASFAL